METKTREAIMIAAIIMAIGILFTNMTLNYEDHRKLTKFYIDLEEKNLVQDQHIQQIYENQATLEKNQKFVDGLARETNINQQLAQRFFDNMIMELILTNDLKTTGEAIRKHQEDLNKLMEFGQLTGGE